MYEDNIKMTRDAASSYLSTNNIYHEEFIIEIFRKQEM